MPCIEVIVMDVPVAFHRSDIAGTTESSNSSSSILYNAYIRFSSPPSETGAGCMAHLYLQNRLAYVQIFKMCELTLSKQQPPYQKVSCRRQQLSTPRATSILACQQSCTRLGCSSTGKESCIAEQVPEKPVQMCVGHCVLDSCLHSETAPMAK